MKVGSLVGLDENLRNKFSELKELGMDCCQLVCWNMDAFTDETAEKVKKAVEDFGVEITALWCGWPGPRVWDFYEGQKTLGLVPEEYRDMRLKALLTGSDFAAKIGVKDLVTHAGYMPENPYDSQYQPVVEALRTLANHCKANGQRFLFETGQETPVTLLRVIEEIGTGNVGINLDPANLILYGKANPVDAMETIGKYVRGVHGKDGKYPTDGHNLGQETPIGQGRVDFKKLIKLLAENGYDGSITIEREITGDEQTRDILAGKKYLEDIINNL